MKRNLLISIYCYVLAVGIFVLTSCNDGQKFASLSSKQDSLNFANKIYESYPDEPLTGVGTFEKRDTTKPVSWEDVELFTQIYDRHPLLRQPGQNGKPYKGFIIDSSGLAELIDKYQKKKYDRLYLRLARKDNGDYTFLILPMKGDTLIQTRKHDKTTGDDNYDHLDPCPDQCPTNFDTPPPPASE